LIYGLLVDGSARGKEQGEAMNVRRPWTKILTIESGKGTGKKVIAHPVWGEDYDPIPAKIHVTVNSDTGEKVIGKIDGPFKSIEETEELAVKFAVEWYDRGNA
jgi:hypothetical protein